MGKPKKGKKGRQDDDFGDDDIVVDPLAQAEVTEELESVPKPGAGKKAKAKKKKKDDDWEEDVASEVAALSLADSQVANGEDEELKPKSAKAKKKDKKKKQKQESDEEEDDDDDLSKQGGVGKKQTSGMSAFAMLAMEDAGDNESEEEQEEEEIMPVSTKKGKGAKKQQSVEDEEGDNVEQAAPQQQQQQKKKGKKEKKNKAEDEDIDAILADLDKPAEKPEGKKKKKKKGKEEAETGELAEPKEPMESKEEEDAENDKYSAPMTPEDIAKMYEEQENQEEERKKKKKKKKEPKTEEAVEEKEKDIEGDEEGEEEDDAGSTVKTAAQKKKEKRERQKQQKLLEKQKGNKSKKTEEAKPEAAIPEDKPAAEAEGEKGSDNEADEDKKKKKKDRKKKKGEKEEEEKKKKPGNKQLRAMQEALLKLKEDEERLEQEEDEKIRKLEEARKAKEEAERLDKEKKEKEKQKKKERIERQKKEGTFKTKSQKEAEKRGKQLLEARGLDLPQKPVSADGEKKKRIVYDSRPRKKKTFQSQNSQEVTSPTEETPPVVMETVQVEVQKEEPEPPKEEVLDSWEDVEEKLEEEKPETHMETDLKQKEEEEKESEEEESEEEEEESEEEDESEEGEEESSEEDSSEDESSDDGLTVAERARERAEVRINKRREQAKANKSLEDLRAPVVCVLGHVDTGKTKILDKLRKTNVQDGEAGGITQQIGATNVPADTIRTQTKMCKEFTKKEMKLPGLLIIDTPGHESFSNLRTRGSSLCDIAILVVDIMHGLEPQTIESINLLKMRKTPFVVALNKVDRLFQWQSNPHADIMNTIKKQKPNTKAEFDERVQGAIVQFAEQGLNVALSYENKNPREYISLCPTSAISGDGMGNLIGLICELSQSFLADHLAYIDDLQATVMEVKALPGLGTTIDVILVNGHMKEGDTIIVAGTEGPIVTSVRGLLMPQPLRELRVKSAYIHYKEIKAAQGVKIIAKDLDKSLAGLPLYVASNDDEVEYYKEDLESSLAAILEGIKVQSEGVFVQASTLGSLEALLEFLRTSRIPYAGINIGPVHKRDIMRASVMLEHDSQYAVILAFDVKVEREAQEMADNLGVRIFTADIIYHLFDAFTAYRDEIKKKNQEEYKFIAVFPCKLRILPQCIFNSRDPIVCGVVVDAGFVKEGTPVCVPSKEFLDIGRVTSIELNHKAIAVARKGQEVCIKIEPVPGDAPKLYGRHFDHTDIITSKISRQSIDAVKNYFREEMTKTDWQLIMELKKLFEIL